MKRSILVLGVTIAALATLPSCTKNLKDDVKDLQTQVDSLRKRNEALREQAKNTGSILGSNEPITATTSYKDATSTEIQFKDTYSLKSGDYSTQYMEKLDDGTYYVKIHRFLDVNWYEGASCQFIYDPATKVISQKRGEHYWTGQDYYWADYNSDNENCDVKIDLKSINMSTGDVSLEFTATANGAYTAGRDFPRPGVAHTTKFAFTGRLKILEGGY